MYFPPFDKLFGRTVFNSAWIDSKEMLYSWSQMMKKTKKQPKLEPTCLTHLIMN